MAKLFFQLIFVYTAFLSLFQLLLRWKWVG